MEKMIGYHYRIEKKIREIANMRLCDKMSCYHCHKKKCPVHEDAIKRLR